MDSVSPVPENSLQEIQRLCREGKCTTDKQRWLALSMLAPALSRLLTLLSQGSIAGDDILVVGDEYTDEELRPPNQSDIADLIMEFSIALQECEDLVSAVRRHSLAMALHEELVIVRDSLFLMPLIVNLCIESDRLEDSIQHVREHCLAAIRKSGKRLERLAARVSAYRKVRFANFSAETEVEPDTMNLLRARDLSNTQKVALKIVAVESADGILDEDRRTKIVNDFNRSCKSTEEYVKRPSVMSQASKYRIEHGIKAPAKKPRSPSTKKKP